MSGEVSEISFTSSWPCEAKLGALYRILRPRGPCLIPPQRAIRVLLLGCGERGILVQEACGSFDTLTKIAVLSLQALQAMSVFVQRLLLSLSGGQGRGLPSARVSELCWAVLMPRLCTDF